MVLRCENGAGAGRHFCMTEASPTNLAHLFYQAREREWGGGKAGREGGREGREGGREAGRSEGLREEERERRREGGRD